MLPALHTGTRASEIAGLQWADLDIRNRFLRVRRQYRDGNVSRTKQRKARKVDVSDVLLAELQTLKKHRTEQYLAAGKNEVPEWIFVNSAGKPHDMDNWRNRIFWKACDAAGIRRRRVHDTRHTFASILLMAGESPQYVKEQLGHSSIRLTVDTYGHFIPGTNRQAVNKIPSINTTNTTPKVAAG